MRRSEAYLPTSREAGDHDREAVEIAHRAGLVERLGSGVYAFAPAGERVRRKVIRTLEREMEAIGGQRISLPQLQYRSAWERSGRWENFEDEMFTFENRDGADMCLAPSHEEGVVDLVDGRVRSYDDLPLLLYQVGAKHRDDHARNGLLRTKEFTMKDAYSLHADRDSLAEWYERVRDAYRRIFEALGVEFVVSEADDGVMGGTGSEEFVAPVDEGTCELLHCGAAGCRYGLTDEHPAFHDAAAGDDCPDCGGALKASEGIEVGHVFRLGTRYSEAMDLTVDLADGTRVHVEMGSYGIGVTRVVQTLIEQHADADGCWWPVTDQGSVAPFAASVIPLRYEGEVRAAADRIHEARDDVLLYDGDRTIGERFAESDLLGIPTKVVLGNRFLETGEVELESRDGETRYVDVETALETVGRERRL
ncbi:proline--tRNA ligase [Halostella sp. JP-L12]|uniref:aminoacyl--tRNA ligase-related protein n=1 Tax=Halostella TaxID=1843185 RepID=UPI000EF80223|nr:MULTISPECIES: aminoacyl--tRNA ligase-related protein [Halostella]NHN47544.1 proline--tRNA ligase [Halostella sp. JP-L12]